MVPSKIWQIKSKIKAKNPLERRKEIFKVVLNNRNLKTKEEREDFQNPKPPTAFSAEELGMKKKEIIKAVDLIKEVIKKKEKVIVYGDYDTDGICSTAIIWEALKSLKIDILPFIPDREKHGYGLSVKGIKDIIQDPKYQIKNSGLIITVDNGIVAHQAVAYCQKKGLNVIITDHHQIKLKNNREDLPPAEAIIHSVKLSGSGVAFFFVQELFRRFNRKTPHDCFLELASIGTIADLMPLQGVNRSLVKFGLEILNKTQRTGLKALYKLVGLDLPNIGIYELSYLISPRINAMGRLSEPLDSLRLLCTNNQQRAADLAKVLDKTNRLRQNLMEETFLHAREKARQKENKKIIFISDKAYNQGIIGLVAGKLSETFYRPAVVTTEIDGLSKGSSRSIKGFNLIKFLRTFEEDFVDLGGHKMAAGFTIKTHKLKTLEKKLEKLAGKLLNEKTLIPKIEVDCELKLKDLTLNLFFLLEKLAPFGLGNPKPLFSTFNVKVVSLRRLGREEKHLKLIFDDPETSKKESTWAVVEAIGFNLGPKFPNLKVGDHLDLVYSLDLNQWNGQEKLQLVVKDIRLIS